MPRPAKVWWHNQKKQWCATIHGRKVLLGKDHSGAVAEANRLRAAAPDQPVRETFSFRELATLFVCEMERAGGRASTRVWYTRFLKRIVAELPDEPASDLKPFQVKAVAAKAPGAASRRGVLTTAKRVTSWAWREGYLDIDPLALLRSEQSPADQAPKLPVATFWAAMDAAKEPFASFLHAVAYAGGARPGEMAAARVEYLASTRVAVLPPALHKTGR